MGGVQRIMAGAEIPFHFEQVFGEKPPTEEVQEADIISALDFDSTGNYIATGDRGGRVVVLERKGSNKKKKATGKSSSSSFQEYSFYSAFQSHEPAFDYLKSLEIEEKINQVRWMRRQNSAHILLTTNDKTVKIWKLQEKCARISAELNVPVHPNGTRMGGLSKQPPVSSLRVPRVVRGEPMVQITPRRVFANAHVYHINSISLNCDQETFLSADDLRINIWNVSHSDSCFNVVDIKPDNFDDLMEVITSCTFHPLECHTLAYATSRGRIRLVDLREKAICDHPAREFEEPSSSETQSFFNEVVASVSDVVFSSDGKYMLSREYMCLKLWDLAMEKKPVVSVNVHEHIRSKLCDLYENDCIFDKFECAFSGSGSHMLTGSYSNNFHVFDKNVTTDMCFEASKLAPKKAKVITRKIGPGVKKKESAFAGVPDFGKKVLHVGWHPTENTIAMGSQNLLYIYHAPSSH